jgi:hypothetical protein
MYALVKLGPDTMVVDSIVVLLQGTMDKTLTWKCFVLPGVAETGTFFVRNKALIVELLPTFG